MRVIPRDQLSQALESAGRAVFAPVEQGDLVTWRRWQPGDGLKLDGACADNSPKDIVFPQWEDLMQFRREGKAIEIAEQPRCGEEYVIFGARACDIRALQVLDKVFLAEPADTFYAARRERGTIVGLACREPGKSCFCGVFGVDPAMPEADAVLWETDGEFAFEAYTEKGRKLVKDWPCEERGVDLAALQREIREKAARQPYAALSLEGIEARSQTELFDSPLWQKLSVACLGCGSCTFACPTCQCYDIRDYDAGSGVRRYRCWDSCMYSDFTLMAGGQPRATQAQRFRQRFMHKLRYFPENNGGVYSCVGCGRCVRKCPMGLHIARVIKALGEEGQ